MQNGNGQAKIRFSLFTRKSQDVIEKMLNDITAACPGEESPFKDIPQGKEKPSDKLTTDIINHLLFRFSLTTTKVASVIAPYEFRPAEDNDPQHIQEVKKFVHHYITALDQVLGCEEMEKVGVFQNVTLQPKTYNRLFSKILECASSRDNISDTDREAAWDCLDTLRWVGNNKGLALSNETEELIKLFAATRNSPNEARAIQNKELISYIPKVSATALKAPEQSPQLA